MAEKTTGQLQTRLDETEVKLTESSSDISAWDEELVNLKEMKKNYEQVLYNMSFRDADNSASLVISQSQNLGFMEVWMAIVNALDLPKNSPFRDAS